MTARHAAISDQLFQPLVAIIKAKESRWNRYRVWKPLSLMVLLGVTPREWDISIVEENLGAQDYEAMPRPDLVGITVFTSQVNRNMKWPLTFGVWVYPPVPWAAFTQPCAWRKVMECVDSVVTGEEEGIWPQILEDARNGELKVKSFISFCSLPSLWCWIALFRDENQCNYLNPCRRR